jgi:hypothetical protein
MPRYAIVTIIDAPQSEMAWENVRQQLLDGDSVQNAVAYVGAPWLVPGKEKVLAEYETDSILLRINGESISLDPAD